MKFLIFSLFNHQHVLVDKFKSYDVDLEIKNVNEALNNRSPYMQEINLNVHHSSQYFSDMYIIFFFILSGCFIPIIANTIEFLVSRNKLSTRLTWIGTILVKIANELALNHVITVDRLATSSICSNLFLNHSTFEINVWNAIYFSELLSLGFLFASNRFDFIKEGFLRYWIMSNLFQSIRNYFYHMNNHCSKWISTILIGFSSLSVLNLHFLV